MNAPTDWTSAVAIFAGGLVLGFLVIYFFSRRGTPTIGGEVDLVRKDLEAKRDALVQQLRELDSDTRLTPEQIADTRARLERETADVLRALDEHRPAPPRATSAPSTISTTNPAFRGFLWGFGTCGMLVLMAWLVVQTSKPREEGGSLTGGFESAAQSPQQQQQQRPASDPEVQKIEAAVAQNPNDLRLRNDLAQAYLEQENFMGVFEQTKFVLEKNPNDSRALTYHALVRLAMGESPAAIAMLQKATESEPANLDAWIGLAWIHAQEDRMNEAEKAIASAARVSPESKPRLEEVFRQMQAQIAAAKQQPPQSMAGGQQLPSDHPPINPTPAPAAGGNDRNVRVTLSLDPAAKSKTGVIFVIARNPAGGPPVAVKRLAATSLPITIDFGAADSMMGQPLPDRFRLEARLDTDGDPMSKAPGDPTAMQENVAPGATVALALK